MKPWLIAVAAALAGYALGLFTGIGLIEALSTNTHDRSVEAAMTSAFIIAPLTAVIAFFAALYLARRAAAHALRRPSLH